MDLSSIKKFLSSSKKATIDDLLFRLHYRFTVALLLLSATLVAGNQFFNEKINCYHEKGLDAKLINTQCWAQSTFSLKREDHAQERFILDSLEEQGVRQSGEDDLTVHRAYYQWVAIALLVKAMLFYVPHFLWRSTEQGRIEVLVKDIRGFAFGSEIEKKVRELALHLATHPDQVSFRLLSMYFICHFLNLVMVTSQFYMIGYFLNTDYLSLGGSLIDYWTTGDGRDPMIDLFPLLTKCKTNVYGSSGDINIYDNLCLLPLNIFNAKIYSVLCVWLILLNVFTFVGIIVLAAYFLWFRRNKRWFAFVATSGIKDEEFKQIARHVYISISASDYFLLSLIQKNLSPINYQSLVRTYYNQMVQVQLNKLPSRILVNGQSDNV